MLVTKLATGQGRDQQDLAVNAPVPLAIVNGGEDAFINNAFIAGLPYKNLWENQVYDMPGIGHAPFWEDAERFDADLGAFAAGAFGSKCST